MIGVSEALKGVPVLVTGASGFIGRRLLACLQASGADVSIIARSTEGARMKGVRVHRGALAAGKALDAALAGQAILFHLAYDIRAGMDANLAAFDALYQAAERAGVGRIVHASSIVVYRDWPAGPLTEAAPVSDGPQGPYRRAKIEMEARLAAGQIPCAMLQPTLVYGPGSALWTDAPIAMLKQGPVILPDPVGICPAVYVDDVVAAAMRAAVLSDLGAERFIINGPPGLDWRGFFEGYAGMIGQGGVETRPVDELTTRLGPVPTGPPPGPSLAARVSAVARQMIGRQRFEALVGKARALRPASGPTYPDRGQLGLYSAQHPIPGTHAAQRLGFQPQIDFAAGLDKIKAKMPQ